MAEVFEELFAVNVNGHTETKKTGKTELTYLSWTYAWSEVKKRYPDAAYTVWKDADGRPYAHDNLTGYMVYTTVTIGGISHEMWLPVMDSHNAAMKSEPYHVETKYSEYDVSAATMFDINKTIMRCLVKNLAMFGLGLYIYAGEDIPQPEQEEIADKKAQEKIENTLIDATKQTALKKILSENGIEEETVLRLYNVKSVADLTEKKFCNITSHLKEIKEKQEGKKNE